MCEHVCTCVCMCALLHLTGIKYTKNLREKACRRQGEKTTEEDSGVQAEGLQLFLSPALVLAAHSTPVDPKGY